MNKLTRNQKIAKRIAERYSQADELALTNAGIANPNDAEYIEYREFVASVKAQYPKPVDPAL